MTEIMSSMPLSTNKLLPINRFKISRSISNDFCDYSDEYLFIQLVKLTEAERRLEGWAAHISDLLTASNKIKRAAIVDIDGDLLAWTEPPTGSEFTASFEELTRLVAQFNDIENVPLEGCDLEDIHYIVLHAEEDMIFGKKGSAAFVAVKTNRLVLIACYDGGFDWSVIDSVDKLAAYLMTNGH